MRRSFLVFGLCLAATAGRAVELTPELAAFRELYSDLIEINTTLSSGSCTRAAEFVAAQLRTAGFDEQDISIVVPEEFPAQGNLVAVLRGSDPTQKALLLLAHLDVVEANREDWERDPFALVEEDGYFYGRGTVDDKAMVAIFVDALMRYRAAGYRPPRDIKMALTCGEETPGTFNGVRYLVENHRDLIDAEFAINEAARGRLDADGKRVLNEVQGGEKIYQNYRLEVTNPGGHSSVPLVDNAIYRLASALLRIQQHAFPVEINDVTRAYFERMANIASGPLAADMRAVLADPPEPAALRRLLADPGHNAILHTTCVATMLDAGHAPNALPQRAAANVNCRIMPGQAQADVMRVLEQVMGDPGIRIDFVDPPEQVAPPPELTQAIMEPIERITERMWPGVPVVPIMLPGATDARFLTPAGIPTYGVSGLFVNQATVGTHGLNERIGVEALYEGREFLDGLIRAYAERR
jgi:acetylornithine deacetylase/succinyl-diaminopimelate desuccinylase-like protein